MPEDDIQRLPIELERLIFELTARVYPDTITTLILVARRICVWIEPFLYQVVLSSGYGERVTRIMASKPPEFLRQHVQQHLALSCSMSRRYVSYILSTCTNIQNLALWTGDTYPALLDDMRHLTNLRRLSVSLFKLFGGNAMKLLPSKEDLPFSHLTHLDVFGEVIEPVWPVFGMLPCLTHLSISDQYIPQLLQRALDEVPTLRLLVVVWTTDPPIWDVEETVITDPRFCTIFCHFDSDWEIGALGGLDFWCRAEDFIARRARGEIEKSEFQA
ncbi:hypothetical protein B0H15DRAFT_826062 [Mycena belliarum]|uniref:Uncharacterized protein n=1 Tax=Mycena belliarum TaxID=1033014 RepID=A0AAD6UBA3_9AGAR|nr:hypothetical protein B0H15DRAFT_826062 [Mycena belliae]